MGWDQDLDTGRVPLGYTKRRDGKPKPKQKLRPKKGSRVKQEVPSAPAGGQDDKNGPGRLDEEIAGGEW